MTLQELKDLLSTYGVNDSERNAPVLVEVNGEPVAITGGEVDWMPERGHTVVLVARDA